MNSSLFGQPKKVIEQALVPTGPRDLGSDVSGHASESNGFVILEI